MDKRHSTSFEATRCLVTGASEGFGRALARGLALARARAILTSRTLAPLESIVRELLDEGVEPSALIAIDADLTEAEGRNKLIHAIDRHFGALDVAINAAEIRPRGPSGSHPPPDLRALFDLNVFAQIDLTRAIYPLLRAGRQPTLVNLGTTPEPTHPEYHASRAAIAGFTQAIRSEWSSQGIHILLMNREIIIQGEKNHIKEANLDHLALQTLEALHDRRQENVPKPRPGHHFDHETSFHRFTPRFVRQWMHRLILQPSRAGERLPRPHFAYKIQRSSPKGD